jgi:hypothetical protein
MSVRTVLYVCVTDVVVVTQVMTNKYFFSHAIIKVVKLFDILVAWQGVQVFHNAPLKLGVISRYSLISEGGE